MSFSAVAEVEGAKSDLGYHEGNNNYNRYSEWQYGNPNNPWCLSATCYWANVDGGFQFWPDCTFGVKGESYTPTMAQRAKAHGVWRDKNWRAAPGDMVEFDWGNNGLIDHVEMVVFDDGITIITIGGNTSDAVLYRRRDRTYVAGFIALSEAGQTAAPPPLPPKVRPMFDPPLHERARLRHPHGKGWWIGYSHGRVDFLPSDSDTPIIGGMIVDADDKRDFGDRILARLKHRQYNKIVGHNKVLTEGYTIVTTDESEYVPRGQH